MTSVLSRPSRRGERIATRRHYLMCPPAHFAVTYAINPWMHPDVAVDVERALAQWDTLRRTYRDLGHRVDLLDPVPGLPDMVYAANGATVVDGQVYGARFRYAERGPEADAHRDWFRAAGYARVVEPEFVNEGEGDLLVAGGVILAGSGFRTDPRAHAEAARVLHREVVPLEHLLRLQVGGRLGAEAVPREHEAAVQPRQVGEVALALVDSGGRDEAPAAAGVMEGFVEGAVAVGLRRSLRVAEPRAVHDALDAECPVRRVHHVGEGGLRRQDVDGVPESLQRLAQAGPLLDGKLDVDGRARLHPRIDRVLDGEVLRRAHQICPLSRLPFRHSHDHKR